MIEITEMIEILIFAHTIVIKKDGRFGRSKFQATLLSFNINIDYNSEYFI